MFEPNGEFGGVVVRSLRTAGGVLPPGHQITADDACSWPVANRQALANSGAVRWHGAAITDEPVIDNPVAKRGRPSKQKDN